MGNRADERNQPKSKRIKNSFLLTLLKKNSQNTKRKQIKDIPLPHTYHSKEKASSNHDLIKVTTFCTD